MLLKDSTLRIYAQQALGKVAIYMLRVQPVLLDVALGKRFIQQLLKEDLIDCLMQRYVRSKDGEVDIPLLILTQNSTANGSSSYPTLLYGYGGQSLQAIQRIWNQWTFTSLPEQTACAAKFTQDLYCA